MHVRKNEGGSLENMLMLIDKVFLYENRLILTQAEAAGSLMFPQSWQV